MTQRLQTGRAFYSKVFLFIESAVALRGSNLQMTNSFTHLKVIKGLQTSLKS